MKSTHFLCAMVIQYFLCGQILYAEPFAYVTSWTYDYVTVIDLASNTIIATIHMADTPAYIAITPDNKTAYVTCYNNPGLVKRIDIATNTIVGLPIPTSSQSPLGIAITPNGNTACVASLHFNNSFSSIDIATNIPRTPISGLGSLHGIAITPDGTTAYVAGQSNDTIIPINIAANTAGMAISVGQDPIEIAITPDGKKAFVTNLTSNNVTPIILPATVGTPIAMLPGIGAYGIAITPDGNTVYVTNYYPDPITNNNYVTPIAVATDTAGTPINIGQFGHVTDIAITPDGKTAYVTAGNYVVPIDIASNTPGTAIDIGRQAYGIAITFVIKPAPQTSNVMPTNVLGVLKANIFLNKTEHILTISWNASSSPDVVYYNIYRGDTVVGKVLIGEPLSFVVCLGAYDYGQNFAITAVNASGSESDHVPVVITY